MFAIPGYETTEQIYESAASIIYRAVRGSDQRPVILKVLADQRPPPEAIARFKREYMLLRELALPGVIGVVDHLWTADHWVIVEEDFGGVSLDRSEIAGEVGVPRVIEIGVAVCDAVASIHRRDVIHKDVSPSNILRSTGTGVVKLIDFGISVAKLREETIAFEHASRIEGTPGYLSPEQTGRINRPLDYRTDIYSLGCTLYQLLTGRLPFTGDDVAEIIHGHITREPEAPRALRHDVPERLSAVVLKAMAKDPDKRYQSARGLRADLDACLEGLRGAAPRVFDLGGADVAPRLRSPSRLYGRDAEVAHLLGAFDRACRGETCFTLVSGYSGVGKSTLVKELYRPITERRGLFAAGKFEQYERNVPYAPFIEAINAILRQILCEGDASIASRRDALLSALGPSCAVLVEAIPRLELVTGPLPPASPLPPVEANERFLRAARGLLRAFARDDHPLVLFLDDLQWSDAASLELIKSLFTADKIPHLLFVGAYRDNEVDAGHPLTWMVRDVEVTHRLALSPLAPRDVMQMLMDVMRAEEGLVAPLSALIYDKTGGNPFFLGELLKALDDGGMVYFDEERGAWGWDMDRIRARDITDNVVDLVMERMVRLAPASLSLLRHAACLGNRFDLRTLVIASGEPANHVAAALLPAVVEGLVTPLTGDYRLLEAGVEHLEERVEVAYKLAHDRVQQAAYTSIPQGESAALHLAIGRRLAADPERDPMEIVRQLNVASGLVTDPHERSRVARLNLMAGERARSSAARKAAFDLFTTGLSFLADGPGASEEDLHVRARLTERAAEAAYLLADFEAMDALVERGTAGARSWHDKVGIYQIRINALTAQNKLVEAIDAAWEILEQLGVTLPRQPGRADLDGAIEEVYRALGGRSFESLLDQAPAAPDAEHRAALRILDSIHATTAMTQQSLGPIVAAKMVQLSAAHGRTEESISGYIYLGIQLCARGRIEEGYQLARLARRACGGGAAERAHLAELASNGYYHVFHWKEPMAALVEDMKAGYQMGLDAGQIALAVNCLVNTVMAPFIAGAELSSLEQRMKEIIAVVEAHKQGPYALWLRVYRRCALNLVHPSDDPTRLLGEAYDEDELMPVHRASHDDITVQLVHILKVMLCYRFDQHRAAVDAYTAYVEDKYPPSGVLLPSTMMYYCLALLALSGDEPPDRREASLDKVRACLGSLEAWAAHGPMSYAHKYHLVRAELARVLGDDGEARELYDMAIDGAREHGYLNEESLALERAALFYRERGRARLAGYAMRDAHYAYQRWGAAARSQQLRERYPDLLSALGPAAPLRAGAPATGALPDLDLGTVLKASRAISAAHDLQGLLRQIMAICLEHAGARRGALVLARGGELIVKARGEIAAGVETELISEALSDHAGVSHGIIHYVAKTAEPVVLDDAAAEGPFQNDPHVRAGLCRSVLCTPIVYQGELVAIAYMENDTMKGAFKADRLEVLGLLMAQAAVSIENTLLRSAGDEGELQFSVGGSLTAGAPSYVRRRADADLVDRVTRGELCYVLNARQMGKSSLRVRAMDTLARAGSRCASVDLTNIGSETASAEQWYAGIARAVLSGLALDREVQLRTWWRERSFLSPSQRLFELIDGEVLSRVPERIVIFLDEIDMVLSLPFSFDDFFALIRSFYNKRADDARYERLTFVIVGVAAPADLVRDRTRTPFNVGCAIPLSGFRFAEARALARGFSGLDRPEEVLKAILTWTDGQPFLTQRVCQLVKAAESRPPSGKERAWVAALVRRRVLDNWRSYDEPEHLKTIEARVLRSPNRRALLELYLDVLERGGKTSEDTPIELELTLSGLAVREWGRLRSGSLIYASIFDIGWATAQLNAG